MPVLATWSPTDHTLGLVVSLGLAVATKTCLVVDLDIEGPRLGSTRTLADLVREGPTRTDLEPRAPGAAFLANGGVPVDEATDVLHALAHRWPAMVLRTALARERPSGSIAVGPLLPDDVAPMFGPPRILQRTGISPTHRPASGTIVLPRPGRMTVQRMLSGSRPAPDRWVRSLSRVWTST